MKILGVIVLYFPDIDTVINNIKSFITGIDFLLVWDNTPSEKFNINIEEKLIKEFGDKIIYKSECKNLGIGYALNQGISIADKVKCNYVLTMDQDSCWDNFNFYKNNVIRQNKLAIYCPNKRKITYINDVKFDYAMQSGSFYPLDVFKKIGVFKSEYFIDAVDTEFCLRAKKNGIPTICIGNSLLYHNLGNPIKRMGISSLNYPPFRTYHIVRNHVWMWREYRNFVPFSLKKQILMTYIINRFIKIILLENNKCEKLKSLVKGLYHGLTYKIEKG